MVSTSTEELSGGTAVRKPLRLWPGVVIVVLQWLIRFIPLLLAPEALVYGILGGIAGGAAVIIWWVFFSRASRSERWGGLALIAVALAVTSRLLHESMRLMPFFAYIIPFLSLSLVVWALASRHIPERWRRLSMAATVIFACGIWTLFRTGGITGGADSDFAWRWSTTPEERLLAGSADEPIRFAAPPESMDTGFDWPGFRGPDRDGIIHGGNIAEDWSQSPPAELWRRPVGPGWSSFAVQGALFYTQEQRGGNEIVACYSLFSGEPVWRHSDEARFWESNSGAGPRGTPTLSNGRVYSLGGTGILNVLDAVDGSVVWSRNAAADSETEVPTWGISSSPLVLDDTVIVAAAGSLIAYDIATGTPRWVNHAGGDCYSSPHLLIQDGVEQILLMNDAGIGSVSPADGAVLWEFPWPGHPIVQPAITADGDILISADERNGVRLIAVARGPGGWTVEERWASPHLTPYFNDSVIHKGNVFGFKGPSLACIGIDSGANRWRGGRYGRGQFILLADRDLLLVLSEKGDLALVRAVPDKFTELARVPAIKGKTWNHPVLVGDILLVRNSQEMAAFRLPAAGS